MVRGRARARLTRVPVMDRARLFFAPPYFLAAELAAAAPNVVLALASILEFRASSLTAFAALALSASRCLSSAAAAASFARRLLSSACARVTFQAVGCEFSGCASPA